MATEDLRKAERGVSEAHIFRCDDNEEYIVKFSLEGRDKTVINEVVAGTLASRMNLSAPEIVVVNVPQVIIDNSEDLTRRHIRQGEHLGVKKIKDAWDFNYFDEERLSRYSLENENHLYGALAFDNWVFNIDRCNPGNNMLQLTAKDKARYVMVDFGHCFSGNEWDVSLDGRKDSRTLMRVFPFFRKHIKRLIDFEGWFNMIEKFDDKNIDEIISAIPHSWNCSADEKTVLVNFIKHRKSLPRNIVTSNSGGLGL